MFRRELSRNSIRDANDARRPEFGPAEASGTSPRRDIRVAASLPS
jgi:hypothetical protein